MALSEQAKQAQREYKKRWYEKNREHVLNYQREYMKQWREKPENKEKVKQYNERYWNRKAQELSQRG